MKTIRWFFFLVGIFFASKGQLGFHNRQAWHYARCDVWERAFAEGLTAWRAVELDIRSMDEGDPMTEMSSVRATGAADEEAK